jgi:pimeloyl-ACP methyl ester carboxylesterase
VWERLLPYLTGLSVVAPDRPCTGDVALEVAFLREVSEGAVLVGVGGGATLGLAMLAAAVPLAGAVLHEPAAGSLVPGLLDPMAAAYAEGGVTAFAAALYGPTWTPELAPTDAEAVRRDLGMFRAFEPAVPVVPVEHVVTTVGELSPPIRHRVGRVLTERLGLRCHTLEGCAHAAHLERPDVFAAVIRALAEDA